MPTLHIQVLGGFHLKRDGTPVTDIDTARLQSFLCYLLVHSDKPQPRHYIASMLWQDSNESQARTNLRKYLHQLRSTLPDADRFLHVDGNTIQWRQDALAVVDIHEFERCIAQANECQKANRHDDVRVALEQAVVLYQGDLLPACYDEWIALPRERLASQYMQALDQLAYVSEQQRNYTGAIHYVQKLLEQDTLRESSYRRLIHLYMLAGNRAKAIETYQQCVDILRQEMDIEPSKATHKLYERVKATPQHLISRMNQTENISGVRTNAETQPMSIMCTDIADFSTLSTIHDSQSLFADFNLYMNLLGRMIQDGNGQVIKRMGDAILAMFDHASDALQVAYAIHIALRDFNQQQHLKGGAPFHTRIGLATGDVLIARLDMEGTQEIEIMGKCVNIAVQLQQITPINGIASDQLTYTQCKTLISGKVAETVLTTKQGNEQVYIIDDGMIKR